MRSSFAIAVVFAALMLGFGVQRAHSRNVGEAPGSWDREGAAKYLDDRMDLWFANGKKLHTGEAITVCVSCHTTVPYVLARPLLRQSMHTGDLTPQESRIINEATKRVESYEAHQLLYDHTESKKTESRGTEAVLNALILASADAAQSRREPSAQTQKALKRLWATQRPDGAWDWLDFGLEPFETVDGAYFGATLAAVTVGSLSDSFTSRDTETLGGVRKLRGYLKDKYAAQSIFNRSWLLLASTRLNDLLNSAQRTALITEIQARQREDGGWSLESLGDWRWSKSSAPYRSPGATDASLLANADGYGTGLIVYALRRAGLPVTNPAVSRGMRWLVANQQEVKVGEYIWHAWRAHSLNFDREHGGDKGESWRRMFMSDSATAFAVLALVGSE
jgi:hypothetical protein